MNKGIEKANSEVVLFLDDDIVPGEFLVGAHREAHEADRAGIIAGQVLQPGESPAPSEKGGRFRFNGEEMRWVGEFMAGNFSMKRDLGLALGGFDENFVRVAYRFEAEFAETPSHEAGT